MTRSQVNRPPLAPVRKNKRGAVVELSTIRASRWAISAIAIICFAAFVWACKMMMTAFLGAPGKNWPLIAIALGTYLLVYLAAAGAYILCSVEFNDRGVCQTKLFDRGRFFVRTELAWSEITTLMSKPDAFRVSTNLQSIEIHTLFFRKPKEIEVLLRKKLPMHFEN